MKIALAQCNYHIGNFEHNEQTIRLMIRRAKNDRADLVVFSELAVCGYPPYDFLDFADFVKAGTDVIKRLAEECDGIAAIVGCPSKNPAKEGKSLFNSAYFLKDKTVVDVIHKTLLPTYDVFDEYRYFEPNKEFDVIEFKGERIALTICEDLWDIVEDPMYTVWPMEELARHKPTMIVNIAASPYHHGQPAKRDSILKTNVSTYGIPLVYVNQAGAQTELLFDGGAMVFNRSGEKIAAASHFEEDYFIVDMTAVDKMPVITGKPPSKMELCYKGLVMGVKDYFSKSGFRKAILGLSGGLDSAVVLVLAADALGHENVQALLMPSRYSSDHSIADSVKLAENLSVPYEIVSIEDGFQAVENTLKHFFAGMPANITEENIQARVRAILLMAFSNKHGQILLNTSNKSEAAVGYGTLYGDMCGGLSVIGDLYKTEVYELAEYINREREVIPQSILLKPPSAELRPDQKDEDSLPPYELLDKILYHYIEDRMSPAAIIAAGYDKELVMRSISLVNLSEHKRRQSPPVLRVSSKAFGFGRRMPIVAKYLC